MIRFIFTRLGFGLFVLFVVLTTVFVLIHIAPGGPANLMSQHLTADQRQAMKAKLGLDRPIYVQFVKWISASLKADFGVSYVDGRPVSAHLRDRIPRSLLLGGTGLLLASMVSFPLGLLAAARPNSLADYLVRLVSIMAISTPEFWLGIIVILIFAVRLNWLPSGGMYTLAQDQSFVDLLKHMVLPAIVLSARTMAEMTRFVRSSTLEVLRKDYIRTARGKGLPEARVYLVHAARNALIPVITVFGLALPAVVGGQVIVEVVFAWPGLGRLLVDAVGNRDYGMLMGATMFFAFIVMVTNILVDIVYGVVDPRIRVES